jgi:hypothetical protein
MVLPLNSFNVEPRNPMIQSYSTWTFSLNVNIPLEKGCWIKILLPPDFVYEPRKISATGVFVREDLDSTLTLQDLNVIYRTQDGVVPKSSVLFNGCHYEPALGKTPFGSVDIT